MSTTRTEVTPALYPFLRYRDAVAAIEWLVEAFGFQKGMIVPGREGGIAHAELSLGRGVIMLGDACDDVLGMKTPRELGAVNQGIYVCVPDPDAHYARALSAGAEIVIPLRDMDYGSREYAARDPEGNLWSFGSYAPGGSAPDGEGDA
jgi:uncharacterized glyoxalase superfamily protein PhnB